MTAIAFDAIGLSLSSAPVSASLQISTCDRAVYRATRCRGPRRADRQATPRLTRRHGDVTLQALTTNGPTVTARPESRTSCHKFIASDGRRLCDRPGPTLHWLPRIRACRQTRRTGTRRRCRALQRRQALRPAHGYVEPPIPRHEITHPSKAHSLVAYHRSHGNDAV